VFVAAFIPDEGESVADINGRYPATATPPAYRPATYPLDGPDGSAVELYVSADTFPVAFAADVPPALAAIAAVAQRPFAVACTVEKASAAAWRKLPSWAVVATADQMIHPDAERAMAVRAGARVVEAGGASHAVALSQPGVVADQIRAALAAAPVRTA
jgi:pimeloyl-ACP methyl ester carboxylesterase